MRTIIYSYGLNAASFVANLAAILFFSHYSGPSGYGTYSIYVIFMMFYTLVDVAVVKTAITILERRRANSAEQVAQGRALGFIRWAPLPIVIASLALIPLGNILFPKTDGVAVGGSFLVCIALVEHLFAYQSNRLSFHLTDKRRFTEVFAWRFLGTILRHVLSWSVFLLTGSIVFAVATVVLRGAFLGLASILCVKKAFAGADVEVSRPSFLEFKLLASFLGTALTLMVMCEMPSVYVDHVYGRATLGAYKLLYDLTNVIWFIATIYPTFLFTHLLPGKGRFDRAGASAKIRRISDPLALLHVCYFMCVAAIISVAMIFHIPAVDQMPFALGAIAGVSILGYSRFFIEAAQAYGRDAQALSAALLTTVMTAAILFFSSKDNAYEIGWAWALGQTVLFAMLKTIVGRIVGFGTPFFVDVGVLLLPCLSIFLLGPVLSLQIKLILCSAGTIISGASLMLIAYNRRGFAGSLRR